MAEQAGLRVIVYSNFEIPYRLLAGWVERHGHRLLLVVTTPGPTTRRSVLYRGVVAASPPERDILITTRMKRPAPLIRSLAPDLILSFSFPYRIPPEITTIPRIGAFNLHPAPLPHYRGPNPGRMFYDDAPAVGATLHRTEADFDTGAILSKQERPMPAELTRESVLNAWIEVVNAAIEEGLQRAIQGEPGTPQDGGQATYAAPYTDAEHWLDWSLPRRTLQCRATALNLFGREAKAAIAGQDYLIDRVTALPEPASAPPGTLLDRSGDDFTLCAGDGLVRATVAGAAT